MSSSSNGSVIRMIGEETLLSCYSSSSSSSSPSSSPSSSHPHLTARAADVLKNMVVLLYFSGNACPPCRQFTPLLMNLYKRLKEEETEDFEIVYCSMDKSQEEFQYSTKNMPWWCIPFTANSNSSSSGSLRSKLACYYKCRGIPHLVILDKDGSLILNDGVDNVSKDPQGFPWRPPKLVDLLPTHHLDAKDKKTRHPMKDLDHRYLMLYFSAYWCPPCQSFTPKLSDAYLHLKRLRGEDDFELLFVSSDYEKCAFDAYFQQMTFGAIPFEERPAQDALTARLGISGIPTLVVLGPVDPATGDRPVINANVRSIIEKDYVSGPSSSSPNNNDSNNTPCYVKDFPYQPKLYGDLNCTQEDIFSIRAVVVFHEGGDDHQHQDVHKALQSAAEQFSRQCDPWHQRNSRSNNNTTNSLRFLWATESTGLTRTVRDALSLGSREPCMVLLDIPDGGSFYVSNTSASDITIETILDFVAYPGERQQL